jgi:hypothetical protein
MSGSAALCYRRVLAEHRSDLPPAADPAQLICPLDIGLFAQQRTLCLDTRLDHKLEFSVESVCP